MHMRGRELQAWAELPDGKTEKVISVAAFLYDWHSAAQAFYSEPKFIPKGTKLKSYAVIDNTATNPFNPDPAKEIYFGQTLDKDEMPKFQCIFHYADE